VTEPLTAVISQELPATEKSVDVKPVTLSEKVSPYSRFAELVGEAGELTVTDGGVRSITTSVLVASELGPAITPEIEAAKRVSRYVPTLHPDAVTR
jgi:hypothetical protein